MTNTYKKILLFLGDIGLFYLSLWLALTVRQRQIIEQTVWEEHWPAFTVILAIWIVVFYINELYDLRIAKNTPALLNKIIVSFLINLALAAVFFYITARYWHIKPQTILILTSIIFAILFYIWRQLINRLFISQALTNNVMFIGFNKISSGLMKYIYQHPQLGFSVKGVIDDERPTLFHVASYGLSDVNIQNLLKKRNIDTVVISMHHYKNPSVLNALYKYLNPQIQILNLLRFYEQITGKIPIDQVGQSWALENLTSDGKRMFETVKRALDFISAVILGLVAILLTPFIALLIIIDSGTPIFFTQTRVGYLGRHFRAIKFRTMTQDAEKHGPEWARTNDPRVTRLGRLLRKARLDELPQLWNVLRGDMSLVGPRPERPEFVDNLVREIPFYKERLLVKPGLSGWAQINFPYGASKEDALEKLQYDLYYIKNRSLGLELSIILRTTKTVLTREGR